MALEAPSGQSEKTRWIAGPHPVPACDDSRPNPVCTSSSYALLQRYAFPCISARFGGLPLADKNNLVFSGCRVTETKEATRPDIEEHAFDAVDFATVILMPNNRGGPIARCDALAF
jgi:hypothetical protein